MTVVGHLVYLTGTRPDRKAWAAPIEQPENTPRDGSIWEHFKGNRYLIIKTVWEWPSKEPLVLYQGLYGGSNHFLRPLTMFLGDTSEGVTRFKHLTRETSSCD